MERVKSLLQRIQEVYHGKHQKSAIDIDLMLDYTRVMYADLLEWRKEFTEPINTNTINATNPALGDEGTTSTEPAATIVEEPVAQDAGENIVDISHKADDTQIAPIQAAEKELPVESLEIKEKEIPVDVTRDAEEKEVTAAKPEPEATPEVKHEFPEEESLTSLSKEHTGISFEPPFHLEKAVVMADTIVEEPASVTHFIEEIPAPTPAEIPLPEFKPYEPAKLFDNIIEKKDIRTSIGINDKYLFLNELFNNHKSDYEETLDKLNQFSTLSDATEWVKNNISTTKKWDREDQTVQGFYTLLGKHFSNK